MSVAQAQREISAREFAEWMVFEETSPGYPERGDLNAAFICTVIANAMSGKKTSRAKPADFLPKFRSSHKSTLPSYKTLKTRLGQGLRLAAAAIAANEKKGKKNG